MNESTVSKAGSRRQRLEDRRRRRITLLLPFPSRFPDAVSTISLNGRSCLPDLSLDLQHFRHLCLRGCHRLHLLESENQLLSRVFLREWLRARISIYSWRKRNKNNRSYSMLRAINYRSISLFLISTVLKFLTIVLLKRRCGYSKQGSNYRKNSRQNMIQRRFNRIIEGASANYPRKC